MQAELTFANLTCYLTSLEFGKYDQKNYVYSEKFAEVIGSYFPRSRYAPIYCVGWKCLHKSRLKSADLYQSHLMGADLRFANMKKSDLRNADLRDANLTGANLRDANLTDVSFVNAKLIRIELLESDLPKFDNTVFQDGVSLIEPIVYSNKFPYDIITDRKYNPKTNRMDLPAD